MGLGLTFKPKAWTSRFYRISVRLLRYLKQTERDPGPLSYVYTLEVAEVFNCTHERGVVVGCD